MTLHADVHLSVTREPAGIYDGIADGFKARARRSRSFDVRTSGTMAPLAVDAFGNRVSEGLLVPVGQNLFV